MWLRLGNPGEGQGGSPGLGGSYPALQPRESNFVLALARLQRVLGVAAMPSERPLWQ